MVKRFLKTMVIFLASAIILFAILINISREVTPLLERETVESWASKWLAHKTTLKTFQIKWHGFDPVIDVSYLRLFDRQKKEIILIEKLHLDIDLMRTLFKQSLIPKKLLMNGANITLQEDSKGHWYLEREMPKKTIEKDRYQMPALLDFVDLLVHQKEVTLKNINVHWHRQNGDTLSAHGFQIHLNSTGWHHHRVYAQVHVGGMPSTFSILLNVENRKDALNHRHAQFDYLLKLNAHDTKKPDIVLKGEGEIEFFNPSNPTLALTLQARTHHIHDFMKNLPPNLFGKGLTAWLQTSMMDSKEILTVMNYRDGQFSTRTHFKGVDVQYLPNWPIVKNLEANLKFSNGRLTLISHQGSISGASIDNLEIKIAKLHAQKVPILNLEANLKGGLSQLLTFVRKSPLKNRLGIDGAPALDLSGPMKLKVGFLLPLSGHDVLTNLKAHLHLPKGTQGSILRYKLGLEGHDRKSSEFEMKQLHGEVYWFDGLMKSEKLTGQVFEQPAKIFLKTTSSGDFHFHFHSQIDTEILKQITPFFGLDFMKGNTSYQARLKVPGNPQKRPTLLLHSHLVGLDIHFPDPFEKSLNKTAQENKDFSVEVVFLKHEKIKLFLNQPNDFQSIILLEKSKKRLKPLRGSIVLGANLAHLPEKNIILIAGDKIKGRLVPANSLSVLDHARLHGQAQWLHSKTHDSFDKARLSQKQPLLIHLTQLDLGDQSFFPSNSIDDVFQHFNFEPFNFICDDLEMYGKKWGHLNFKFNPNHFRNSSDESTLKGFTIKPLKLHSHLFTLTSNIESTSHQTRTSGKLIIKNLEKMIKIWRGHTSIREGSADIKYNLQWEGLKPNLSHFNGQVSLHLGKGRLVDLSHKTNQKLGFARILNLLNIQTLPRRLLLDFSDFSGGYAFDQVAGHFDIKDGHAHTSALKIDGPVAYVVLSGRIDLKNQNYDLKMKVVPYLTSNLPIVATIAGGPVAGAITWAANQIFEKEIKQDTGYHYRISGSWEHPKYEAIDP